MLACRILGPSHRFPDLEHQTCVVDRDAVDRRADDEFKGQRGGRQLLEQGGQQDVTGGEGDGLGQAGIQVAVRGGQPGGGVGDVAGAQEVLHAGGDVAEYGPAAQQSVEVFQGPGMAAGVAVGTVLLLR